MGNDLNVETQKDMKTPDSQITTFSEKELEEPFVKGVINLVKSIEIHCIFEHLGSLL